MLSRVEGTRRLARGAGLLMAVLVPSGCSVPWGSGAPRWVEVVAIDQPSLTVPGVWASDRSSPPRRFRAMQVNASKMQELYEQGVASRRAPPEDARVALHWDSDSELATATIALIQDPVGPRGKPILWGYQSGWG